MTLPNRPMASGIDTRGSCPTFTGLTTPLPTINDHCVIWQRRIFDWDQERRRLWSNW